MTPWDDQWYGGHHTFGYSLLFPPLAAWLGPRLAGAVATVAGAWLFDRLALRHAPATAARELGRLWFGLAIGVTLFTGRLPYLAGMAVALAAVALLTAPGRRRAAASGAVVLAIICSLLSPVAGAFLALAGVAWALARRDLRGGAVAAAALVPIALLAIAFPEGGSEPWAASSFWPTLGLALAALALLPRSRRTLRVGAALYALASVAAFAFATPLGGNAARLAQLLGGPLLACALAAGSSLSGDSQGDSSSSVSARLSGALLRSRQRLVLLALAPALLWWLVAPIVSGLPTTWDSPAAHAAYYQPLLRFLTAARAREGPFRIEIPFTAGHWESYWVARAVPLARGWERQLDRRYNGLFYASGLTASAYRSWLDDDAVRYVALPDAPLDYSARAEARLLRAGLPYLRLAWHGAHWRVWRVLGAAALLVGPARLVALGPDTITLRALRPATAQLRVRFTPYWALAQGHGCVSRAPGGWTVVRADQAGELRLVVRFALGRIGAQAPRCR